MYACINLKKQKAGSSTVRQQENRGNRCRNDKGHIITMKKPERCRMRLDAYENRNYNLGRTLKFKNKSMLNSTAQLITKQRGKNALRSKFRQNLSGFEEYLINSNYGDRRNPYEKLLDAKDVRLKHEDYLKGLHSKEIGNEMAEVEFPGLDEKIEGFVATIISDVLTQIAEEDSKDADVSWREKIPQWIPVNGGEKGEHKIFYRFCDYNEIERMLPRISWETYEHTVESVKEKKRKNKSDSDPDHTLTWDVMQYIKLKKAGKKCIEILKESGAPQKEAKVLDKAFKHMGDAQTRLSPFVSLSEDISLLVNSSCATMQSIVRSDKSLENVKETADTPEHVFMRNGEVQRAKGYARAPHVVKFEIPEKHIVTPEMVDEYKGYTEEDIQQGLGLKGMRDAKERLFLGTEIWKFAVAVAANPY